jgi:hypothetical protein
MVSDIWLYALADAARETGVAVHESQLVVNHHHTDVTPSQANLPDFIHRLHTDTSKALNELMEHEGYEPPRSVFDDRPTHCMRLLDAPAQVSQLIYTDVNTAAAGLVRRPEEMPGRRMPSFRDWLGDGIVIPKPPIHFGKDRPSELVLRPEPAPLMMLAFGGDLRALVYHLEKLCREALSDIRAVRKGPPLGAQRVRRLHPHDEPSTPAEPRGQSRAPSYRIGARGFGELEVHERARDERRAFLDVHEACRQERLAGEDPSFPHGTFAMRVFHNAPVDDPLPDALLAAPGPLLEEVLAELEERPRDEGAAIAVVEGVRGAWNDESLDVTEREAMRFDRPAEPPGDLPANASGAPAPDTAVTVHQHDRRRSWEAPPSRLIVRRDSRRGRPKKKVGVDPPSDR